MLSKETLERYRRMTAGERLGLTLEACRTNFPYLFQGPPDLVKRRFELLRKKNDEHNRAMLEGFAALELDDEPA